MGPPKCAGTSLCDEEKKDFYIFSVVLGLMSYFVSGGEVD